MVTYYNEKDLVLFGKYLLSKERQESINAGSAAVGIHHPDDLQKRLEDVYHADICNWKDQLNRLKNADLGRFKTLPELMRQARRSIDAGVEKFSIIDHPIPIETLKEYFTQNGLFCREVQDGHRKGLQVSINELT